jgi:hypothetical protein
MKCKTTSKTERQPTRLQTGDVAAGGLRELTRRRDVFAIIRVLERVWSAMVDRRPKIDRVGGSGTQIARTRRGGPTILAIRARYGDGELNVEARERCAIAGLVVLGAIAALAVIAGLLAYRLS